MRGGFGGFYEGGEALGVFMRRGAFGGFYEEGGIWEFL